MSRATETSQRVRVGVVAIHPQFVSSEVLAVERRLAALYQLTLVHGGALDDPQLRDTDLLIVGALGVDGDGFASWLERLAKTAAAGPQIWTPAVIVSDLPFDRLADQLSFAHSENWYFDILHPDHVDSLPIRVANLLRISAHLRELLRYDAIIHDLRRQTQEMEERLQQLHGYARDT